MHAKARAARGIKKHGKNHRVPVLGVIERKGRVKAQVIARPKMSEILPLVKEFVEKGSNFYTDDSTAYDLAYADYVHETVNHSVFEYVRGAVHTNSIENFWSILKRTIRGTYVSVSPAHLQKYVGEQVFRYNERHGNDKDRFAAMRRSISFLGTATSRFAKSTKRLDSIDNFSEVWLAIKFNYNRFLFVGNNLQAVFVDTGKMFLGELFLT